MDDYQSHAPEPGDEAGAAHEPPVELFDIAEKVFSTATAKHRDTDDNRDLIHGDFDKEMAKKVGAGEIQVTGKTVRMLLVDFAWQKVNQRAGQRTQSELKRLYHGQMTLDDTWVALDHVVVVGEKRRSTLRHLTPADVQRMLLERQSNRDKQQAAFAEFESIAVWLNGLLAKHKTLPDAIKAGAVRITGASA